MVVAKLQRMEDVTAELLQLRTRAAPQEARLVAANERGQGLGKLLLGMWQRHAFFCANCTGPGAVACTISALLVELRLICLPLSPAPTVVLPRLRSWRLRIM